MDKNSQDVRLSEKGEGSASWKEYQLGNEYRKAGNFQEALNHYMESIALDPESPAVHAKQMVEDILNYYCKDMYNP